MDWLRRQVQRLLDARVTARTRQATAERECRHDGTPPLCEACLSDAAIW